MLPRFQHILVPVDFTEKNLTALDLVFDLAVASRARVTLLHVIETIDVEPDAELNRFYGKLQERADSELERLSQRFVAAGLAVDSKTRYGKRLSEIVSDIVERKADLVVMSSHKPDLAKPLQTWATLSYQVSVLCPCPVLLVKLGLSTKYPVLRAQYAVLRIENWEIRRVRNSASGNDVPVCGRFALLRRLRLGGGGQPREGPAPCAGPGAHAAA